MTRKQWAGLFVLLVIVLAAPRRSSSSSSPAPSSARRFRTDPLTGATVVNDAIPTLHDSAARLFDRQVERWRPFAVQSAAATGIPVAWILGVIFAESGGNPDARSPVGAIGLMQLFSPVARGGLSDEQLRDPQTNVSRGTLFLKLIADTGDELPHVASKYNAGAEQGHPHPSSSSPWGMREQPGYIDRVVAAANYALGLSGQA